MGFKARILTLAHFIMTFVFAVILAVGFASNNWINARFLKHPHGVKYASGLFLGCLNFPNRSSLCSAKIAYVGKGLEPEYFLKNLVNLAVDSPEIFTLDEEYFDEGLMTFTSGLSFPSAGHSMAIYFPRYTIAFGLVVVVVSAMINFFLSCVYSVKTTKYAIAIFISGSVLITTGSNIIYLCYCIDSISKNPEMEISMGFGMYLTIIGVIGVLFMCILLSVTLSTVEKAKIKDIEKTARSVVHETMRTMGRSMQLLSTMQGTGMETKASVHTISRSETTPKNDQRMRMENDLFADYDSLQLENQE